MNSVIVLGSGAIGLCCAHYLHGEGLEVTIVDRDAPGLGCSWGNAGMLTPSHFVPLAAPGMVAQGLKWMFDGASPFYIRPRLDLELARWLWHFNHAATATRVERAMPLLRDMSHKSLGLFRELAPLGFGLIEHGLVMYFNSEKGRQGCLHEAELANRIGVEARVLDVPQLRELEPEARVKALGGVFYPGDAQLDPSLFSAAMAADLAQKGVKFLRKEGRGFHIESGRLRALRTDEGDLAADTFVLAAGCWSALLAKDVGLSLPMQAGKGYSFDYVKPPLGLRFPSILAEARVAITPMGGRLRIAGTMELAGVDLSINRVRVEAIRRAVPRYFEVEMPAVPEPIWSGLRPCSPDGLPFIGPFPKVPNLIAATGHAMLGITLAPITGRLVADLVTGRRPSLNMDLISPDRF